MHENNVTRPLHIVLLLPEHELKRHRKYTNISDPRPSKDTAWEKIIDLFMEKGTKYLTLAVLSDNSSDPEGSIHISIDQLIKSIEGRIKVLNTLGIKIDRIMIRDRPNQAKLQFIKAADNRKKENGRLTLNVVFFDDGRTEIVNAIKKLLRNNTPHSSISEGVFRASLPYKELPDPDMIVTVGSGIRLNNPFLWQSAYSELHSISTPWNNIGRYEINSIFEIFRDRKRRFGGIAEDTQ